MRRSAPSHPIRNENRLEEEQRRTIEELKEVLYAKDREIARYREIQQPLKEELRDAQANVLRKEEELVKLKHHMREMNAMMCVYQQR